MMQNTIIAKSDIRKGEVLVLSDTNEVYSVPANEPMPNKECPLLIAAEDIKSGEICSLVRQTVGDLSRPQIELLLYGAQNQ